MQKDENKPVRQKRKSSSIPIDVLIEAEIDKIEGMPASKIAEKHNVSRNFLEKRNSKISEVMASQSPLMAFERKIISEAISDRLKPIKEELAVKSLEIIRRADDIVAHRLETGSDDVKMKDLISISDTYSKRLARITGIEEDPEGGADPNARAKVVNTYVQNIFHGHNKTLEEERVKVNDTTPTPVKDAEIENE